jgi:sugar fermentation stimulation protein A
MFPDAPTVRGQRHLLELADAVKQGYRALVIFIVTRSDARLFKPHSQRDPRFAEALQLAAKQGVKICCFTCNVDRKSIKLKSKIPVRLI